MPIFLICMGWGSLCTQTAICNRLGTNADLRAMIIVWGWIGTRKGPSLLKWTRRVLGVLNRLMALRELSLRIIWRDHSTLKLILARRCVGLIVLEGSS